jgi:hypothetical protein
MSFIKYFFYSYGSDRIFGGELFVSASLLIKYFENMRPKNERGRGKDSYKNNPEPSVKEEDNVCLFFQIIQRPLQQEYLPQRSLEVLKN